MLAVVFGAALLAAAGGVAVVVQKGRAFSVASLHISRGDTIRFNNEDDFVHQAYVESPSFSFETDEQEPGTSTEIRFPKAGTFEVRCHIHPKMLLIVDVR
jgi:plastocyanin